MKRTAWNKGIKNPVMSLRMKGNSIWKGRKHSTKTKSKLSAINKGRKHSEETKRKISLNRKGKLNGEKHPQWKDGRCSDSRYLSWLKNRRNRLKGYQNLHGSSHTLAEWQTLKAQYNWTCPCCKRKEPEIFLTEDHIIPLSKGGSDNIENIQPLCRSCNCRKYSKIIKYNCETDSSTIRSS